MTCRSCFACRPRPGRVLVLILCLILGKTAAMGQELSVSANFADYLAGGTLNMEAAYGFARHWTVSAGAKYNPFSFQGGYGEVLLRQRSVSAGLRWWPWHIYSGWWMGSKLQYQEFAQGGLSGPQTTEGDRYGAGLSAGYSAMLGKHFNLDIGLGVWGGYSIYSAYACQKCGRRIDSGSRFFVLPNDYLIAVSYIF